MIKINKNLSAIPDSLKPPTRQFFPAGSQIPITSRTTHQKRMEAISAKKYTSNPSNNERYKLSDVKDALKSIYHNKCAFCEQRVEMTHVEHYRPKVIYYWLAYSWDNLLIACHHCNTNKGTHFDIRGMRATFVNSDENIRTIHGSLVHIDASEQPLMVNPEVTNPSGRIRFNQDGSMDSDDEDFKYTIDKCKISRAYLRDARRRVLEKFKNEARSILVESKAENQLTELDYLVRQFINTLKDQEEEFLAFRKFAIDDGWLIGSLKEVN